MVSVVGLKERPLMAFWAGIGGDAFNFRFDQGHRFIALKIGPLKNLCVIIGIQFG